MKTIFRIFVFMAFPLLAFTQEQIGAYIKYKFLKRNGGFLVGEIIEKKVGGPYHIKLDNGTIVEIADYELLNLRPIRIDRNTGAQKVHEIHEYKWGFNTEMMLMNAGASNIGNPQSAIAAQASMNRYLSPFVSIGIGMGVFNYDLTSRRLVVPVFAQSKLRFYKSQSTPVVSLGMGYGIASKNYITGLKDKSGGLFVNPFFGYELGTTNKVSWTLGIGILLQKAYYSYENGTTFADENILFKRTELKLGIEFH